MEQKSNSIVDIRYEQTGASSVTDELEMREMQAKAYAERNRRFLLIKAPPASGKSRALMFIALDKLWHQARPQRRKATASGIFADMMPFAYSSAITKTAKAHWYRLLTPHTPTGLLYIIWEQYLNISPLHHVERKN